MAIKPIKQLTFRYDQYPELIAKLNAVAPYKYVKVHQLAQAIMMQKLDEMIEQNGIDYSVYLAQLASFG